MNAMQLQELLNRLCDDEALEILWGGDRKLYIPFIMNDAAEAYCVLSDVVVPGTLPDDFSEAAAAEITPEQERNALRIRTEEHTLIVIWYGKCQYVQNLYQYHRIMHCWVEGNEHMRMLVNTIGTIRDKLEYLGEDACNETERSLIPLLEYRPFRHFSPISESIDRWYPESRQGFETMKAFVMRTGEKELLRLMRSSRLGGKISGSLLAGRISEGLARSAKLFSLLYRQICEASSSYEERRYPEELSCSMEAERAAVHAKVLKAGYEGEYPAYRKGTKKLLVFEEHPFTIPEMDDMEFAVHLLEMGSETESDKKSVFEVIAL